MAFATRADLLARSNAMRLVELAVPADKEMLPDDALRTAITGGNISIYTADEQATLALALDAIDKALADADALLLSYGIPPTVQTTLLARLASTVALYYLQGGERMAEDVSKAYDGVIDTLKSHSKGLVNLIPPALTDPVLTDDAVVFESSPRRYGSVSTTVSDW